MPTPESPWYSLHRLVRATRYSLEGLASAFRTEPAFRLELVLSAVLIPLALVLEVTAVEKALLIASVFSVLIAELVNTAIETLVDRISPEIHPLSKRAKDVGSAIVFSSLLNAICIWTVLAMG